MFVSFEANACDKANCGLVGVFHHHLLFDPQNGRFDIAKHYVLKGKCPMLTRKIM